MRRSLAFAAALLAAGLFALLLARRTVELKSVSPEPSSARGAPTGERAMGVLAGGREARAGEPHAGPSAVSSRFVLDVKPGGDAPETSSLEVSARDARGAAVEAWISVQERAEFDRAHHFMSSSAPVELAHAVATGGSARIDGLPPRTDVIVVARGGRRLEPALARATTGAAGGTVAVAIEFPEVDAVWRGRLVGLDVGARVGATTYAPGIFGIGGPLEIDALGNFRLRRPAPRPDVSTALLAIEVTGAGKRVFLDAPWHPGEHDLGDIEFDAHQVLVAGTVEDPRGEPVSRFLFHMTGVLAGGRCVPLVSAATDERGYFVIRGRGAPSILWQAGASGPSASARFVDPPLLQSGTLDARVVVDLPGRGGELVRVDGVLLTDLEDALAPTIWVREDEPGFRRIGTRNDGTWSTAVRNGSAVTIEARLAWRDRPAAHVEIAKAASDTPLVEIDLRGKLRAIQVRGIDASGAHVAIDVLEAPTDLLLARRAKTLVLDRWPVDVVFRAHGWEEVRVDGLAEDVEVRFDRPAPRLSLVWRDIPSVPADVRLSPVLVPPTADPKTRNALLSWAHGAVFDAEGLVTIPVPRPGTYAVHLVIHDVTGMTPEMHTEPAGAPLVVAEPGRAITWARVSFDADLVRATAERVHRGR